MPHHLAVIPARNAGSRPRHSLHERLAALRDELLQLDETACVSAFRLDRSAARLLKSTISLCPECLRHVTAIVYADEGGCVLMRKHCPVHGYSDAVLENDLHFYRVSNKDQWGRRFTTEHVTDIPAFTGGCCDTSGDCGCTQGSDETQDFSDQMTNKSCTVLVEVTNACNLACPVCYSDAKGDRKMPLDLFK